MNLITEYAQRVADIAWNYQVNSLSIFGTIGNSKFPVPTHADFIPVDSQGNVMYLNGQNVEAQWLGLENKTMQYYAYRYCAHLAAVIERIADAETNGHFKVLNEDFTNVKNPKKVPALARILKLTKRPNPAQTWQEFYLEQSVMSRIYGYCPVFALRPAGMDNSYTSSLWNINPLLATPNWERLDRGDFYKNYGQPDWDFQLWDGSKKPIPADAVIFIKDGFINDHNTRLPLSKIAGLDFFVSNICAAMEADNVLLKKKGPLGVISHDPKPDIAGWEPMKPGEKEDLQRDLSQYGLSLGQLQYVIAKTPVKWNAMSFNAQELMTKETSRNGIDAICDRFGYPAELMSGKNATYENRNSSEKYFYQNNIIPCSTRKMAVYAHFFGLDEYLLILDYDHVAVLQEDALNSGQALKAKTEALDIQWKSGLITFNQYLQELDYDTVTGMDIFYDEWLPKYGKAILQMTKPPQPSQNGTAPKNTVATK